MEQRDLGAGAVAADLFGPALAQFLINGRPR
jgi:hypothetical protein